MTKLFVELEPGDEVRIGADTIVRLESKTGRRARVRIDSAYKVEQVRAPAPARPAVNASPAPPMVRRPIPG